ncbi:5-hydroxytryptamine receptor 2C-like [Exaiptasia diaphana]|uniref:G-protein coupled receptors family 1 profile domain-containing protein n=1 Tax=Exaiptasia diaphana TaxID=2652724 RepID=A0A913X933_EXADI|nr:5-hydroxytryptamine receptor 2C-like [Exaiptasia diaphana]
MSTSNSTSTCFISVDFENYNITDLPDTVVPVWTTLAIINGIASPFTAVLNALMVWTILGDHELRSKTYNTLLVSLAVTDLLVGLVVEPLYCQFLVSLTKEPDPPCLLFEVYMLAMVFCAGMTLCTLMIQSVERYLAIQLPIFHYVHVKTKRVMTITVATWICTPTIMLALRMLLNDSRAFKQVPFIKFILGNTLVIIYCTARVHITAYYKRKTISNAAMSTSQQSQQDRTEQQKQQIKEYKRAFTMGILVLTSVIFYFPFITVSIIQAVNGKEVTQDFQYIAKEISATIIHLQSLINPFIISLRIKKIRKGLKKKMMCRFN